MAQAVRVSPKELREDFEAVFDGLRAHGDLVWVEAGEQRFLLVNEPELVSEALVRRSEFVKPRLQAIDTGPPRVEPVPPVDIAALRREVTRSLAGRDDDAADAARAAAAVETAAWRDGASVELMPMLRRIAIATAVRGAFASELDEQSAQRLDAVLRWLDEAPRVLPESRFSRHSLRAREMQRHLRDVAVRLVASGVEELAPGVAGELLVGAVGPIAQTGAWLLYRFATEPDEAERLRAEWPATERTQAFVREVTRLHPTNPRITRAAVADTTVGGEAVPRGTRVVLNVNAISRDPRFYDEPDRLLPDRWLDGRPHKFAYLSFGIGERRCLGESFALAALTALLPALAGSWRLTVGELRQTTKGRRQLAEGTRLTVSVC
jgi:cytochrome P450